MVILLVDLKMLVKMIDSLSKKSDMNLSLNGIRLAHAVGRNDLLLSFL